MEYSNIDEIYRRSFKFFICKSAKLTCKIIGSIKNQLSLITRKKNLE